MVKRRQPRFRPLVGSEPGTTAEPEPAPAVEAEPASVDLATPALPTGTARARQRRRALRRAHHRRGSSARRTLRVFGPFALPYKGSIAVAGLLVILGTAVGLLRPWPLAYLVDELLHPGAAVEHFELLLLAVVGAVVGLALLDAAIGYLKQFVLRAVGQKVAFRLRLALYAQLQRLSLTFHDRQQTGDLLTRVTKDVDKVTELVTDNVVEAATNLLLVAGMVGVMLFMDWRLTVVVVALSPILLLTNASFRRRIKRAEEYVRRKEGDITSLAQETISSIKLVKAFGREQFETDRFETHTEEALDANLRVSRTEAAFSSWIGVLPALATAGMVWMGAHQVRSGDLEVDQLLVFIAYLREFYGPTRALSKLAGKVSRASVRAEKIAEVLQATPAVADLPGARPAPPLRGAVAFENVSFGYLPDRPVLNGVDFSVEPGQVLALVGSTGEGKSTIVSLVPRLYDPTEGVVRVDGCDLREFTLASLQAQVSVVLQESVLFRATVRENIAYGRPDATFPEIVAAARAAKAHEFIEALPEGYETVIGERGDTLSGGQRQRIAIARALIRDAPILILDEPTTGLDATSEQLVLDALDRLMEGRTTIVVAHKLAAVRRADVILVIEDGRVVERGTHAELVALGGRYAEFHAIASGQALPPSPAPPLVGAAPPADDKETAGEYELDLRERDSDADGNGWEIRLDDPVGRVRPSWGHKDELAEEVLATLRSGYDLGQWLAWHRTPEGTANVSFFVSTMKGEYVLRVSNGRKTEASMRFELRLIEYLRAHGYPAPRVVPTRAGEPCHPGPPFYLVTERIPGRPYDPASPVHLREAGRALARYHRLVRGFPERFRAEARPVPPTLEKNGPVALATFAGIAEPQLGGNDRRRLTQASSYLWSQFIRVPEALAGVPPVLPQLVIQGSFGRSALIYDEESRVVGVVDYDRSTYDLRALDLAYAVKAFARASDSVSHRWVGLDFARCADFMAAYGEVEYLPAQELAALPLIFRAQRLFKVLTKTENFLRKHEAVRQAEKDVLKVVDMAEREADRVRWLEEQEDPLVSALGSSLVG